MRKVTRIFFKTLGVLTLLIILLGVSLYFAVQSFTFQTWLGQKASMYLSQELNNKVSIKTIRLEFFKNANLEGVFISDKNNDTIFKGDLLVDIKTLDYENQKVDIEKITLRNSTAKLIKSKTDSLFNFQFIIDYFDTGTKDTTKHTPKWDIKLGDIYLEDLNFVYRDDRKNTLVTQNMNFNNLNFTKTSGKFSDLKFDMLYCHNY